MTEKVTFLSPENSNKKSFANRNLPRNLCPRRDQIFSTLSRVVLSTDRAGSGVVCCRGAELSSAWGGQDENPENTQTLGSTLSTECLTAGKI